MANTSSRRVISRPGVNADGTGSNFQSPYQPPPAGLDFAGDLALMTPGSYTMVYAGSQFWRVKVATPAELQDLAQVPELKGGAQIIAMNSFLQRHLHPEDFRLVIRRMLDPDDSFTAENYSEMYRLAVTVGTARPFLLSSASHERPSTAGASSVRSSPSPVFHRRFNL